MNDNVDRRFGDAWGDDGPKSIDQNAILAATVLALQEALARIEKLEAR